MTRPDFYLVDDDPNAPGAVVYALSDDGTQLLVAPMDCDTGAIYWGDLAPLFEPAGASGHVALIKAALAAARTATRSLTALY